MRKFPDNLREKFSVLKNLKTPADAQDFLDAMPVNFQDKKETCMSPLMVLRYQKAQCIEGAMLAAAAFWYHGAEPLILDLRTADDDDDHVVAPFKYKGRWGAVSKTNHAVLRFRDPVYNNIRELAMSYFHEYFLDDGRKTLREYSAPFNLAKLGNEWLTARRNLWDVSDALDDSRHFAVAGSAAIRRLRLAHPVEREAGKIVEWKNK